MRLHKFNLKKEEFKLKQKRNKNNIIKVTSVVCIAIIAVFMISYFTRSRFTTSATLESGNTIGAYITDGNNVTTKSSNIPGKNDGYVLDTSKGTNGVSCTNGATGTWDNNTWGITITNATQSGTRCDVYFKEGTNEPANSLYNTILAAESASITSHGNTAPAFTGVSTTDDGLYKTTDDLGDVYYYRGNVQDNYVSFAGFCWRVVRTNGDHSVRLIYQGTTCDATGDNASAITSQSFSKDALYNDNAYVGYMYGTAGSSTYAETHANTNSSNAKTQLENWYATNLSTYDDLIADQIFCNDRKVSTEWTSSTGKGFGTNVTSYGARERALTSSEFSWDTTQYPTLICSQAADKFTKTSANGNGALSQKVGMLTYDEAVMAGGFGGTNNPSYYLFTGAHWWLGSPSYMNTSGNANVFFVYSSGHVGNTSVSSTFGLRPVISLLSSAQVLLGDGSQANPWIINTGACTLTTCTLSDCGSYGSCSATYTDQTGTKTRTCTQTCTAASDSSIICSTDTNYQDSTSCTGTQPSVPWVYTIRDYCTFSSACSCSTLCPKDCSNDGYTQWSCASSDSVAPTSASQSSGQYCWCK